MVFPDAILTFPLRERTTLRHADVHARRYRPARTSAPCAAPRPQVTLRWRELPLEGRRRPSIMSRGPNISLRFGKCRP